MDVIAFRISLYFECVTQLPREKWPRNRVWAAPDTRSQCKLCRCKNMPTSTEKHMSTHRFTLARVYLYMHMYVCTHMQLHMCFRYLHIMV